MGTRMLASWMIADTIYGSILAMGDLVPFMPLLVHCFSRCQILPSLMDTLSGKP